ncbi:MAG: Catenin-beta-like protein [Piptocephalis tieghemiana]|nr:MAG: Catenin-beta-like protein [Piptocephalis tieghemiana]
MNTNTLFEDQSTKETQQGSIRVGKTLGKRKLPGDPSAPTSGPHRTYEELTGRSFELPGETRNEKQVVEEEEEVEEREEVDRLFGDGLSVRERQLLEYVETAEAEEEEGAGASLEEGGARRLLLAVDRAVARNREAREKHPEEPSYFMESEGDLDEALKHLRSLSDAPHLYVRLVEWGTVPLLLGLLSHPNADIAMDVVEIFSEWLDDEVEGQGAEESMQALTHALMKEQAPELLMSNLKRLKEEEAADRQGVFQTLSIFESLISIQPDLADALGEGKVGLMDPWILNRVKAKSSDSNRTYAAELLAILLQQSEENRGRLGRSMHGVESLLQALALYKRRDPVDPEAQEHLANLVDALCSSLSHPDVRSAFLEAEGMELMILMLQEKKMARLQVYKILSFLTSAQDELTRECLERFIHLYGLRYFTAAWMQKGVRKLQKSYKDFSPTTEEENLVSLLVAMLRKLPEGSEGPRERVVAQFAQDDYARLDRLLEMRESWRTRVVMTDQRLAADHAHRGAIGTLLNREERYLDLLESGLFTLQLLDMALVYLCHALPGTFVDVADELEDLGVEYAANLGGNEEEEEKNISLIQEAHTLMQYLAYFIQADKDDRDKASK